ncbi:MAG: GNAT family N-acetyltransferase [Thermoleophilaceae bacterium]
MGLSITDQQLLERQFASLRVFVRAVGEGSPGGSVVERPGVIGSVSPAVPTRSIMNSVVYDQAGALEDAWDDVASAYDEAGVSAWTVWVAPGDEDAARLLGERGHRLDGEPLAMAFDIGDFRGERAVEPEPQPSGVECARLNDEAYGYSGDFERGVGRVMEHRGHLYMASADGRPASCTWALDEDGDCGIFAVATAGRARGRGLAGGLISRALLDAQERGCVTSSLQATRMGEPVYERLGYRALGRLGMWERRR